jgi:hypothetical protein
MQMGKRVSVLVLTFSISTLVESAPVLPPLTITEATAEDGLLALAKAYDANIYVDSSKISPTAKVTRDFRHDDPRILQPERHRFVSWGQEHKLSTRQNSEEDYFFWAEPEFEGVWQALNKANLFTMQQKLPSEEQFTRWLRAYLEKNPQEAERLSQPFSLAEAPEPTREWLASITITTAGRPTHRYIPDVFTDSFWSNASFSYRPPRVVRNPLPGSELEKDPVWPFQLQALLAEKYSPVLLHYNPFWGHMMAQSFTAHRVSRNAPKTAEGITRTQTVETHVTIDGFHDLRVRETTLPNATTAQRFIESRPSLSDDKTPWQKIEDEAEIQKALRQMGEIPAHPETTKQALQILSEVQAGTARAVLPDDKVLDKAVSLEMKRQPLPVLLEELSKQSGVKFSLKAVAPQDIESSLVTLRVHDRPIFRVLGRLAELYGIQWTKLEEGHYQALLLDRNDWRVHLLQLGDFYFYRYRNLWNGVKKQRDDQFRALVAQVWDKFGEEALTEPNSVKFADLPADLQKAIRHESDERLKTWAVRDQLDNFRRWKQKTRYQLSSQPPKLLILSNNQPGRSVSLELLTDYQSRLETRRNRQTAPPKP